MSNTGYEQRRDVRVLFSKQERVSGYLSYPETPGESFKAVVMNMSRSGIGFALNRNERLNICKGICLSLKKIEIVNEKEKQVLTFPENMEIQIQWIMDDNVLDQIGIGCKYMNHTPELLREICRFVNIAFPGRMALIQAEE